MFLKFDYIFSLLQLRATVFAPDTVSTEAPVAQSSQIELVLVHISQLTSRWFHLLVFVENILSFFLRLKPKPFPFSAGSI